MNHIHGQVNPLIMSSSTASDLSKSRSHFGGGGGYVAHTKCPSTASDLSKSRSHFGGGGGYVAHTKCPSTAIVTSVRVGLTLEGEGVMLHILSAKGMR